MKGKADTTDPLLCRRNKSKWMPLWDQISRVVQIGIMKRLRTSHFNSRNAQGEIDVLGHRVAVCFRIADDTLGIQTFVAATYESATIMKNTRSTLI